MIEMRRRQLSFGDGLIAAEVNDLREDWMKHADTVLADEAIVAAVYEALAKRHPKSGRNGTAIADPQAHPNRWVGLGVIADNVVNIGRAMERQALP